MRDKKLLAFLCGLLVILLYLLVEVYQIHNEQMEQAEVIEQYKV